MISPVEDAKDAADSVQDSAAHRFLVRGGLIAFGVVHLLVGLLAIRVAMGVGGGEEASQSGALRELAKNPLGPWLLGAVAVGLLVIALWQAITAFIGHRTFSGSKRLRKRASSALRAILYGFLGVQAARIALFGSGSQSGGGEESLTASLLAMPFGAVLVGIVGLAIVGYGGYQIYKGYKDKYNEDLDTRLSGSHKWIARAGLIAKGIAVGIVGSLFVVAAFTLDSEEAGGLDQALQKLNQMPFGPWLLGAVAVGLAAYGVYCFLWSQRAKFS